MTVTTTRLTTSELASIDDFLLDQINYPIPFLGIDSKNLSIGDDLVYRIEPLEIRPCVVNQYEKLSLEISFKLLVPTDRKISMTFEYVYTFKDKTTNKQIQVYESKYENSFLTFELQHYITKF